MVNKKPSLQYIFLVEGLTERIYLEHLRDLLNQRTDRIFNIEFEIHEGKNVKSIRKRVQGPGEHEIFCLYDVEGISESDRREFENFLRALSKARSIGRNKIRLAYSNLSFEVWLLLHKRNSIPATHKKDDYLKLINQSYGTNFETLQKMKSKPNLQKLINKISLQDIQNAVDNAKELERQNSKKYDETKFLGFKYFHIPPAENVHKTIERILKEAFKSKK